MDALTGMNRAVEYLEEHLTDEANIEKAARLAACPAFQFQRVFVFLAGMTVNEYLRKRRMTAAAMELSSGSDKVVDIALRYGYDSPTAFNRAFKSVHGISPSEARRHGVKLTAFPKIKFILTVKGETAMDYRIEEMKAFDIRGIERSFTSDSSFAEIPKFWDEVNEKKLYESMNICGAYGICIDTFGSKDFRYIIGGTPEDGAQKVSGYTNETIPAFTWAKFACKGPLPDSLQSVNQRIFSEWLPGNNNYEMAAGYVVEMYSNGNTSAENYYSEIWIPVKKKVQ